MNVRVLGFGRNGGGQAYVELDIDGTRARVFRLGQKLLHYGYDLVFLGSAFERLVPPVTLPPDPTAGRDAELTVHGYSDDPAVLEAYRRLVAWDVAHPGTTGCVDTR